MVTKCLFLLRGWLSKQPAIAKGAEFLLTALVFSLAYTQEAIFNSPEDADGNQNTKYFLGLARAGHGFLERDWLASTIDALPAFTALVEWSYRLFQSEIIFFIGYGLILGLYVFSLVGIVNYLYPLRTSRTRYLAYLGLFIFIHTVNLRIGRLDTGWDLHAGVAKQYLLGPVFQPCNFGVLLLTSIWAFLYGRWGLAVVGSAIAPQFTQLI
ncbi:MAG: hypothetical protein HC890_18590 [Chloroflexaceae bacterium]|nr:hypothetical protein [Chloroflexaceae bacterium]